MKAETHPRSARPPPWRDKLRIEGEVVDADEKNTDGNKGPDEVFDRGESILWLAPSYFGARGHNPRRGDEIPPLLITHNEIHDVDGSFFVTFNGLLQCTMDYTDHVLHARTDRDTMTDSDLAATPSSNDWWRVGSNDTYEGTGTRGTCWYLRSVIGIKSTLTQRWMRCTETHSATG